MMSDFKTFRKNLKLQKSLTHFLLLAKRPMTQDGDVTGVRALLKVQ